MRAKAFRSLTSAVGGTALVAGALLLTPNAAAAQYAAQVLAVPDGLPSGSETFAYGINSHGQVLGQVHPGPSDRRPVLWTNGVPQFLPVPDGFSWDETGGYPHLNDGGTAVGRVLFQTPPLGLPYSSRVVVWQNGGAQIMPEPPGATASCNFDDYYPVGLNNSGHVLFWTANLQGGVNCRRIWIWDGAGSSPSDFQELPGGPDRCPFWFALGNFANPDSHLNDADHVSVNLGVLNTDGTCSSSAGIMVGSAFTPLAPRVGTGGSDGAHGINNHDQVLVSNNGELELWDGLTFVDIGPDGDGFLNDNGQVLFHHVIDLNTRTPRIYANGAVKDVSLPQDVPGCSFEPGVGTAYASALGFNSAGQAVVELILSCGPSGTLTYPGRAVVLTPTSPTLTLKVNGQHPSPPIVMTTGPMMLTLDVSASVYTAPVSWYWALIVNGQALWVTSTGVKTTPAPLLVGPPVAIAAATLLNVTLPPATTVASLFVFVDGSGSALAGDVIVATRP